MAAEMSARESALKRKFLEEQELREHQIRMASDKTMLDHLRQQQLQAAQQQMFPSRPLPAYSQAFGPAYPPYGAPPPSPFMPMNPVVDYSGIASMAAGTALAGASLTGATMLSSCVVM